MKKIKFPFLLFIVLIFFGNGMLLGKESKISGYVEDRQSHESLENVNIMVKGTEFGTTTNEDGYFELDIKGFKDNHEIIFSHVGYIELDVKIADIRKNKRILLVPTEIKFDKIQVEGEHEIKYTQIINNDITVLHEDEFSSGGYLDAADLIVTKNSIMVDESLSGKKTISVRGANAEETLVLYDGIKINSSFNNIFDLSLLNTSTLSQIDIIRGGNLATFGGIGSAAVVNFIPKLEQDYILRFYQRFGSYNSGDWGVNFYRELIIPRFKVFASLNQGASQLNYTEDENKDETVDRSTANVTVNSLYDFNILGTQHALKANYIQSDRDYINNAYADKLEKSQQLMTFKYEGNFNAGGNFNMAFSKNNETENHDYLSSYQNIENENQIYQMEYIIPIKSADIFLGYKMDENKSMLDEKFIYTNENNSELTRNTHDISSGFKIENDNTTRFDLQSMSFNYSYKMIEDNGDSVYAINNKFDHNKSAFMISSVFGGETEIVRFRSHVNYSNDFRLPTPYQMLLSQHYNSEIGDDSPMMMESKSSVEMGVDVQNNSGITSWNFSGTFFSNSYENKYRQIQLSGSPVVFLDSYKAAKIAGIEGKMELGYFQNRLRGGINYSKNMIDDKAAFPFKLESKISANLMLNLKRISINAVWFNESERTGIIYYPGEGLKEIKMDEFANVDLHIEGNFDMWNSNMFCAFSARNLLGGELVKEGIAIRDKRFYVMLGMEVK